MHTRTPHVRKTMETPVRPHHGRDTTRRSRPLQEGSLGVRPAATEAARIEAIWAASQDADNPTFRPRTGWWSLGSWATTMRLLLENGSPIGVAAIDGTPGNKVAEARLALVPAMRQTTHALSLVDQVLALAHEAHCIRTHLYTSSTATWAIEAARQHQFSLLRTQHVMLRPAQAKPLPARVIEEVQIRPLREGEEPVLLKALNRAWAGTWNFHPLTLQTLLAELKGRRDDFFVAVRPSSL